MATENASPATSNLYSYASEKRNSDSYNRTADEPHKPRRVDPERLAVRLGPDLVREMEEYIIPGATMPSFAVRKELQERYNVDRRQLYDYFHSRGLRIAKEEKHCNLARSRALKAQLRAAQESTASTTSPKKPVKKAPAKPRLVPAPSMTKKPVAPVRDSTQFSWVEMLETAAELPEIPAPSVSISNRDQDRSLTKRPTHKRRFSMEIDSPTKPVQPSVPLNHHSLNVPTTPKRRKISAEQPLFSPIGSPPPPLHFPPGYSQDPAYKHNYDSPLPCLVNQSEDFGSSPLCLTPLAQSPWSIHNSSDIYQLVLNSIDPSDESRECAGTYRARLRAKSHLRFDQVLYDLGYPTSAHRPKPADLGDESWKLWLHSSPQKPSPYQQGNFEQCLLPSFLPTPLQSQAQFATSEDNFWLHSKHGLSGSFPRSGTISRGRARSRTFSAGGGF